MALNDDLALLLAPDEDFASPQSREAMARALRRQQGLGTVGQLMGVEPTVQAGSAMQDQAGTTLRQALLKQQAAKESRSRAAERAQEQANWQRNFDEQRRQFGVQEGRLAAQRADERKKRFQHAVDPITGEMRLYDITTGEWVHSSAGGGGMPAPGGGGMPAPGGAQRLPQFNPQLGMRPTEKMKNDLVAIQQQRGAVQGAIGAAQAQPDAFGMKPLNIAERFGGDFGAAFASWKRNPNDTFARSFVLNNVSSIINERAGAAQSVQELQRLRGFLPAETDDVAHVEAKFNAFLDYLDEREAATRGYTPEQLGFKTRAAGPRDPNAPQGAFAQPQGGPRPGDKYLQ